jgi:hypothetical protein
MTANISAFTSWSTTEASNQPDTTDSADIVGDFRKIQATARQYLRNIGADIASASTVDLSTATGDYLTVTGTTTVTALGTVSAGMRFILRFSGALTLTHNATSLILPGGANITTAAGDHAIMESLGSGNWRCVAYSRNLAPSFQPLDATLTALASALTDANKIPYATAADTLGELDFKDEDNMASDSATAVPSQQSVKAYADTALALKANLASPTFTGTPAAPTAATTTNTTQIATTAFVQQEIAAASSLTVGTEQATTSGSSVEWTSIPADTKRITISLAGVGFGIGSATVVIGDSGGYETTGYTPGTSSFTSDATAGISYGAIVLTLEDSANNTWVCYGVFSDGTVNHILGFKSLSGTLTQVKLGTTAAFIAGAANILYE